VVVWLVMKDSFLRVWRWIRWPLFILVGLYCVLVAVRVFMLFDEDKTAAAVAQIHAQKITLADVDGSKLPPAPDPAANNATVAGIDANNNGVRDDVELAIFDKYPTDKKARAAALQYAMTEQMYLTKVTNTPTWKAVAEENGRAGLCVKGKNIDWEEIQKLISNTLLRAEKRTASFEFITSHGSAEGPTCDVSV
jgi:hypothetical protein